MSEIQGGVFREVGHWQPAFAPPSAAPLTHARSVAVQSLGAEIVEIVLKAPLGVHPEIAQEGPGIDARGMHIVESDPDGIIPHGIDGENCDVALAADRLAFRFGVTLYFGGRAGHAEQLRGQTKGLAIVERDAQRAAILREPDFDRPWCMATGCIQGTDPSIYFSPAPPYRILAVRPDQIVAAIADPDAAGGERDGTRLLNRVEQHRHANCGDRRKQQGRNKDFHGASPGFDGVPGRTYSAGTAR